MKRDPYPDWALDILDLDLAHGEIELMRLAIRAALLSIERTGGGPFGAVVATAEGRVVSIGYNLVVPARDPTAHGEVVALRRAGDELGSYRLRGPGMPPLRLFTTCAPCLMCTGAIHWSGVPEVIVAARKEDAEALGFVEGAEDFDAISFLGSRGISYRADFLREEALEIFRRYRGEIYNG
jgi:tRNA(Arg) A34 adenosine deaminase TadA